jgi:competence protein ComEC
MAAAAMAILAFEPAALFEAGAQLSFAAAGALVFAARCPDRRERGWWGARVNAIETVARASATALAATAPIAGWHFGEVTPNGLLANLIAIPWTALLILPSALLCALVSGCGFTALAQVLLSGASWIATVSLEFALDIASRLPPPLFVTRPAMAWFLAVGVALLVTLRVKGTLLRVAGALLVVALLAGAPAARIAPPPPRLIALEVGQGSATIIQGRTAAVLVDAGASMPGGDWGKRAVLPALAALGIEALDLVVVSHGDRDHRGGVPSVLAAIPVAEVWVPYGAALDPAFEAVRRTARAQGAVLLERGAGAAPVVLGDLRVASLWPPARANGAGALDGTEARNDRSLVVGIEAGGHQLLIPGDLEMRAEKALIQAGGNLRAELLVLPHHGSRSSSSTAFLRAVGASVAIASAPCGGRFGMPHQEVLDRAKDQGVSVWWTGRDGAVLVALRDPLAVWGFGPTLGPDRCRVELQGRN